MYKTVLIYFNNSLKNEFRRFCSYQGSWMTQLSNTIISYTHNRHFTYTHNRHFTYIIVIAIQNVQFNKFTHTFIITINREIQQFINFNKYRM